MALVIMVSKVVIPSANAVQNLAHNFVTGDVFSFHLYHQRQKFCRNVLLPTFREIPAEKLNENKIETCSTRSDLMHDKLGWRDILMVSWSRQKRFGKSSTVDSA